jgi:hypothetical protein
MKEGGGGEHEDEYDESESSEDSEDSEDKDSGKAMKPHQRILEEGGGEAAAVAEVEAEEYVDELEDDENDENVYRLNQGSREKSLPKWRFMTPFCNAIFLQCQEIQRTKNAK